MDEQELVNGQLDPKEEQSVQNEEPKKEHPNQDMEKSAGQLRLEQELEEERLHQERRARRIERMKKEKQRQEELRSKMKLYIGIGAGCICLVIALIIGAVALYHQKSNEGAEVATADHETGGNSGIPENNTDEIQITDETASIEGGWPTGEDNDDPEPTDVSERDGENTEAADAESGNGIFYPGYTAQITEDTPYISSENVISSYAILLDLDTGEVVAQRDAKAVISPASMTKILTLLVAAEHVTDLDDTFTMTLDITDYAYVNDCSTAGFLENEVVTVRDLMYGTILPSGGEAAAALAVYTAGSLDAFIDMMNDKLAELGLSGTAHFTNCVGLYDENHHCSVYDMAMILKAAAENELCREVLSAHTYTTSATEQHPEGIILSNWFLRRIEDKDTHGEVVCAKTGFVNQSGSCGASYAVSNSGKHYICVTGNAWSSWRCIYDQVEIYQEYTN